MLEVIAQLIQLITGVEDRIDRFRTHADRRAFATALLDVHRSAIEVADVADYLEQNIRYALQQDRPARFLEQHISYFCSAQVDRLGQLDRALRDIEVPLSIVDPDLASRLERLNDWEFRFVETIAMYVGSCQFLINAPPLADVAPRLTGDPRGRHEEPDESLRRALGEWGLDLSGPYDQEREAELRAAFDKGGLGQQIAALRRAAERTRELLLEHFTLDEVLRTSKR